MLKISGDDNGGSGLVREFCVEYFQARKQVKIFFNWKIWCSVCGLVEVKLYI